MDFTLATNLAVSMLTLSTSLYAARCARAAQRLVQRIHERQSDLDAKRLGEQAALSGRVLEALGEVRELVRQAQERVVEERQSGITVRDDLRVQSEMAGITLESLGRLHASLDLLMQVLIRKRHAIIEEAAPSSRRNVS